MASESNREKEISVPSIVLKGGVGLTVGEAEAALNEAMAIIESVGTTGIYAKEGAAREWMKRYYPNWAD